VEDVFWKSGRRLLEKWKTSSGKVEDVFWKNYSLYTKLKAPNIQDWNN
jgi:hypothetical protein